MDAEAANAGYIGLIAQLAAHVPERRSPEISVFTLARWHQFGLTEQVAFLHLPDNQRFTIFLVAR